LGLALVATFAPRLAAQELAPIKSADFPKVAARVLFFEKRINAADVRIRERVLTKAGYFWEVPDKEYVQFLKRMMRDPDPGIRGQAIRKLYELYVPLEPRDLPTTFTGYHEEQLLNREDKNLIPPLIAQVRGGGAQGGWAAYCLGLLRCQEAVPDLIRLGDDRNEFARFTAARALLACGANKEAKVILQELMSHKVIARNSKFPPPGVRDTEISSYYIAQAARAYMELGPAEKQEGLRRLVALIGELEPSKDVNHEGRWEMARWLLTEVSGQHFLSHQEAADWFKQQEAAGGK
jgi:hypothetical protein